MTIVDWLALGFGLVSIVLSWRIVSALRVIERLHAGMADVEEMLEQERGRVLEHQRELERTRRRLSGATEKAERYDEEVSFWKSARERLMLRHTEMVEQLTHELPRCGVEVAFPSNDGKMIVRRAEGARDVRELELQLSRQKRELELKRDHLRRCLDSAMGLQNQVKELERENGALFKRLDHCSRELERVGCTVEFDDSGALDVRVRTRSAWAKSHAPNVSPGGWVDEVSAELERRLDEQHDASREEPTVPDTVPPSGSFPETLGDLTGGV